MNEKNVVYVCSNNYVWMTGISMISLLSHNSGVHIYVIGPDIQSQNRFLLEQTARLYGGDCTVLNIPDFDECVSYIKSHIEKNDIVLTLGAGTVTNIGPMLVN